MRPRRQKNEVPSNSGESGNFWTSYSDLMLGLSVIFLVLFFFATIRTGVEQLKNANQQMQNVDYLKGKIPEQVAEKNRKQQEIVQKSLLEIQKKQEMLANNAKEVGNLVQSLENQKSIMGELLQDQLDKAAALKSASEGSLKLETQVKDLESIRINLDETLKIKEQKLLETTAAVESLQTAKVILEADIRSLGESIQEKDAQISKSESAVNQLQKSLSEEHQALQRTTASLEGEKAENEKLSVNLREQVERIKNSESELAQKENAINKLKSEVVIAQENSQHLSKALETEKNEKNRLSERLGQEIERIREKDDEIAKRDLSLNKYSAALSQSQRALNEVNIVLETEKQRTARLSNEAKERTELLKDALGKAGRLQADLEREKLGAERLNNTIEGQKGLVTFLTSERDKLRDDVRGKDGEMQDIKRQLRDMQTQLANKDGLNEKLKAQVSDCQTNLVAYQKNDQNKAVQLAQLDNQLKRTKDELNTTKAQHRTIASDIGAGLREQGVDAQINPESGNLVLTMDEAFQFKNNSFELSDSAKQKLKSIIPAYAQNLFANSSRASRISNISISGHASPLYKKKLADPKITSTKGFRYNLNLSEKRAKEIMNYIFGDEIGYYPYKSSMKMLTGFRGKGYREPIKKSLRTNTLEVCGPYDCGLSRRVEIGFVLKGEDVGPATRAPASSHYSPEEVKEKR